MHATVVWLAACLSASVHAGGGDAGEVVFRAPSVAVRHEAAAERPVGTGTHRQEVRRAAEPARREHGGGTSGSAADERDVYYVEHEISAVDARQAAETLLVDHIPAHTPGCGKCSKEERAYCEWQVVADHCCCERRFQEPYPWIPHTCYQGQEQCRPVARDCGLYRRLRDCCCDRRLAEKWKHILSSSPRSSPCLVTVVLQLATLLVPTVIV